jgi:hypothetical protein
LFAHSKFRTGVIGFAAIALVPVGGCDKLKNKNPVATKVEAKRRETACASPAAYDRLKNAIFDEAIERRTVDRSNLDMLADYSVARMENPVVKGSDDSLEIVRCGGRFILEVPPGAERGLGGARQLQADIDYTAQASADGAGLVYRQKGAEAIIAKLAAFNLSSVAYRPPPAIDQDQPAATGSETLSVQEAPAPKPLPSSQPKQAPARPEIPPQQREASAIGTPRISPEPRRSDSSPTLGAPTTGGEQAVRSFYTALGAGNGAAASAQVIPEKRSAGPFSAGAMSRFYGRLPEPLRLTSLTPTKGGYRVTYRYSAGRSHCNGAALVRVTTRGGRDLISSIRSISGC